MSETDSETKFGQLPWIRWRNFMVCDECWRERRSLREPTRVLDSEPADCIVCDQLTSSGIFIRVRCEWT